MSTTNSTSHSQSITGLTNASTNTRYIRCRVENTGNQNSYSEYSSNASTTFYVRTATPAEPTVSPSQGSTVPTGTTTITVQSNGATCTWGTSSGSYPNSSGTTRSTAQGTNWIYYSCVAGSGSTQSEARTGSWYYYGQAPSMQSFTAANCTAMATNDVVRRTDSRDGQEYRIKKMPDGKCWMIDNLKYAPPTGHIPPALDARGERSGFQQTVNPAQCLSYTGGCDNNSNLNVARWADPTTWYAHQNLDARAYCSGTTNMPQDTATKCGYTYSWTGATYGVGVNDRINGNPGTGSTINGSICPNNSNVGNTGDANSPWKIPSSYSSYTGFTGDIVMLDRAFGGNGYYTQNAPMADASWRHSGSFEGVYSYDGTSGFYLGSTVGQDAANYSHGWSAGIIIRLSDRVGAGGNNTYGAVRCVLTP